ncbi:hypothetical protein PUN28_012385 [Cardiocondyla obscurior]|uniref:Uncharacterized protein n=1 Tax=Cardiocondyla obscurior TaxID=286306 RepID=A0AAW2FB70_9HYME
MLVGLSGAPFGCSLMSRRWYQNSTGTRASAKLGLCRPLRRSPGDYKLPCRADGELWARAPP